MIKGGSHQCDHYLQWWFHSKCCLDNCLSSFCRCHFHTSRLKWLPQRWPSRWVSDCCLSLLCSAAGDQKAQFYFGTRQATRQKSILILRVRRLPRTDAVAPAGAARSHPRTVGPSWTTETRWSAGGDRGRVWTSLLYDGQQRRIITEKLSYGHHLYITALNFVNKM